jgi:hypothetical protein
VMYSSPSFTVSHPHFMYLSSDRWQLVPWLVLDLTTHLPQPWTSRGPPAYFVLSLLDSWRHGDILNHSLIQDFHRRHPDRPTPRLRGSPQGWQLTTAGAAPF